MGFDTVIFLLLFYKRSFLLNDRLHKSSYTLESLFDPTIFDNSYFTYYLTKGLQRSKGQILPAFDYAQIRTRKLVDSTENCRTQTPEMISTPDECINIDISR